MFSFKRTFRAPIVCVAALLIAVLVFGCAVAEESPAATEAPAWLDEQREQLRHAQQRLIDLGLLNSAADGAYGPKTEGALRAYQAQNGLEETGHLDEATYDSLTYISPENASAKDVQQKLIDLGYLRGTADGIIGPKSIEALKLFQRLNGMKVSGKADAATLEVLFSGEAIALPASLSSGAKGDEVTRLQKRLIQFGFLAGEPDGAYGQSTVSAVKAFQRHLIEQGYTDGITADGVASPLTQYCLYSDQYSTYLRDVAPGVADSEALRIETRLSQLGYLDAPADDTLDDYALAALRLYQDQVIMQPDGLADRETIDALFDSEAPPADHCAPHDIASGDSGLAVGEVESALLRGGITSRLPVGKYDDSLEQALQSAHDYLQAVGDPAAELFTDAKSLGADALKALWNGLLGFRSADMANSAEAIRVQRRLYTLYYLPKSGVDGKFGRGSRSALKEFQSVNGLPETGEADEATQSLLFSASAFPKPYPYLVQVSLDRQVVEVYSLDELGDYTLAESFTCSTGLHNSTPRGIFLDGHPVNRWHYFEKFNCWAQYSFVIEGDIMFHSVIYSSDNEHSLRSGSLYALGNPASHGCVRLKVADAKWLYEHCKRGTVVIVIR